MIKKDGNKNIEYGNISGAVSSVIKKSFFHHSTEVVFRSFTEIIKFVGKNYYPSRGKKIDTIIRLINTKPSLKVTLGGCIIKKINQTVMVSKE